MPRVIGKHVRAGYREWGPKDHYKQRRSQKQDKMS
jgi:hypothetical protein